MIKISKIFSSQSLKLRLGAVLLVVIAVFSLCHLWSDVVRQANYQIFDFNSILSWHRKGPIVLKTNAYLDREVVLPSSEAWRDFELSFYVLKLHQAGIITRYKSDGDEEEYEGFFFDADKDRATYFKKRNGEFKWVKAIRTPLDSRMTCRLKVEKGVAHLVINESSVIEVDLEDQSGVPSRFGFFQEKVSVPPTIFAKISVSGHLASGDHMSAQVRDPKGFSGWKVWLVSVGLFVCFAGLIYLLAAMSTGEASLSLAEMFDERWWRILPWASPLVLSSIIFWPFLTQKQVLVASYDNLGEILPLFFYSKHVFLEWFSGVSRGLWNPIAHTGIPFFTNHWNMAFYPLHWPIFFAPDTQVMFWLTLKAFVEVFFIGWLAYGFFYRELGSRGWALFCAMIYQGGSFLIFSFTIFPTTSLFFMMTLYVYLLWSYEGRSAVWNFVFLTAAVYGVMVSANVAFVFYAVLSLGILTLYRFFSGRGIREALGHYSAAIAAVVTGGLISMIRMLPCLWGVSHSNRLVSDYFSIHDRVPLFLRMFIPDIAGGLGYRNFNAFAEKPLGWVFDNINPQSGFLIYYSVFAAMLIMAGFFMRMKGKDVFWKGYAAIVLAMALLWQPVWGVISILFFPMNHFVYHLIVLPIPLCMFAGKVGTRLSREGVNTSVFKRCALAMLAVFIYFCIFETYLFPVMTPVARVIFFSMIIFSLVLWRLSVRRKDFFKHAVSFLIGFAQVLLWGMIFFAGVLTVLRPFPFKTEIGQNVLWPGSCLLVCAGSVLWLRHVLRLKGNRRALVFFLFCGLGVVALLSVMNVLLLKIFALGEPLGIYSADILFGLIKWAAVVQIVLSVLWFSSKGTLRLSTGLIFVGVIAFLDIVGFNLRYDNIAAPFFYQKAFFEESFEYRDIPADIKKDLDLVNFRVGHQERLAMNANKNAVFDVPSYSGIMGYMPERFAEFFSAFGVKKETILIYPVDAIEDQRFLDLCAVKYIFNSDFTVGKRDTAFSRIMLFFDEDIMQDEEKRLARLTDPEWDYHKQVILSRKPHSDIKFYTGPLEPVQVDITKHNRDRVEATYYAPKPGVVLFNESFDHGWRAYVDGKRLDIVPANQNFMACYVPQGEHVIEFLYIPTLFYISKWISIIGGCVFVGFFLFFAFKMAGETKKPLNFSG